MLLTTCGKLAKILYLGLFPQLQNYMLQQKLYTSRELAVGMRSQKKAKLAFKKVLFLISVFNLKSINF